MTTFTQKQLRDIAFSSSREWLLADGEGGFASSTVCFMNTRRQHSLLTVSLNPPLGRLALLNKVDEEVIIEGKSFFLGTNQYPGTLFPEGYKYLQKFSFDYFPQVTFDLDGNHLTKRAIMPRHSSSVFIHYQNDSKAELTLRLLPLLSFRMKDGLTHAGDGFLVDELPDGVRIVADMSLPRLYLKLSRIYSTSPESYWYRDFIYAHDGDVYTADREDLFNIGFWETSLAPGEGVTLAASTRDLGEFDYTEIERKYVESIEALRVRSGLPKKYVRLADIATNHFVKSNSIRGEVLISGYPYGTINIPETLLSLSGMSSVLTDNNYEHNFLYNLVTNEINGAFPATVDEADLHVRYDDPLVPLYLAVAVSRSKDKENGSDLTKRFTPILIQAARMVLDNNFGGVRTSGLINLPAKLNPDLPTPRSAAVNALWYNLLKVIEGSDSSEDYERAREQQEKSFYLTFFEDDGNYKGPDDKGRITIDMVTPLSVIYSPLTEDQSIRICKQLIKSFLSSLVNTSSHLEPAHACNLVGLYLAESAAKLKSCEDEFGKLTSFLEKVLSLQEYTNCVDGIQKCGMDPFEKTPQDISSAVMAGEAIRLVRKLRLK